MSTITSTSTNANANANADSRTADPRGMPRVPHATEDGLQEGRPHPALRRYQAQYKVVDWTDGLKLMAKRRSGEIPHIKGGVDDGSEEMVLKGAGIPDPYSKMRINPKAPLEREEPRKEETGRASFPTREQLLSSRPGSVEDMVPAPPAPSSRLDPFSPSGDDPAIPADAVMPSGMPAVASLPRAQALVTQPASTAPRRDDGLAALCARLQGDLDAERARSASLERALSEASSRRGPPEYASRRMRVELSVNDLMFGLSAVDVIESMYGVTVLLPLGGDGVTFVPPPGALTKISCQKKGIFADTAFTGASFELDELGLFGLSFMKKPNASANVQPRRGPASGDAEEETSGDTGERGLGTRPPAMTTAGGRSRMSDLVMRLTDGDASDE